MITSLTLQEGLAIQKSQVEQWVKILKPYYSDMLQKRIIELNSELSESATGFDIARGNEVDQIVHNFLYLK